MSHSMTLARWRRRIEIPPGFGVRRLAPLSNAWHSRAIGVSFPVVYGTILPGQISLDLPLLNLIVLPCL